MITETRELVQLMTPDDPMRPAQIQRLLELNEELREALNELETAQKNVINRESADVEKRVVEGVEGTTTWPLISSNSKNKGTNNVGLMLPSPTTSILTTIFTPR